MGVAGSKSESCEALRLCKARKKFIKQAIDSRYNFSAAHIAYIQSLTNIGIALRRFAEAEVLIESSLSISGDKTPSPSSYPSRSPSHIAGISDSPLNESPISPPVTRLSYMRSNGNNAVTVKVNPSSNNMFVEDGDGEGESMSFPMPPPPPPPELGGPSWDYFDPNDNCESFRFMGNNNGFQYFDDDMKMYRQFSEKEGDGDVTMEYEQKGHKFPVDSTPVKANLVKPEGNESVSIGLEQSESKKDKAVVEKDVCNEREDPSEYITHRAKDFLSSIKDIEHKFFRASESGKELSRMLEANKIRIGYSEAKGRSPASAFLATLQPNCCKGKTSLVSHEPLQHVTKVITWKRTTSSRSSSSRNRLATASKDDNDDSGSEFVEEFCMIAGSHSSTLDRLYAWERKLYDEVKASECIRKEYDRYCNQLRHQFAKDISVQVIDKTRAVVKDLHSRIRVALHAVDSISKRVENMRDEELQPQLLELIQGSIRMWKAMLECHHAQYITISLAYHAKTSTGTPQGDTKRQITAHLQQEIECFGLSFADLINSHTSYVEALNGWLQNCIMQPRERSKVRRAFSPRRVLAPPIIVLCRDWSAGIKSLPSEELSDAIKAFLSDLHRSVEQQAEEMQKKQKTLDLSENGAVVEAKDEEKNEDEGEGEGESSALNLSSIHSSLTKVLDRLTKFSEASLKMYEDIRQKSEMARNAYSNYRPPRSLSL